MGAHSELAVAVVRRRGCAQAMQSDVYDRAVDVFSSGLGCENLMQGGSRLLMIENTNNTRMLGT